MRKRFAVMFALVAALVLCAACAQQAPSGASGASSAGSSGSSAASSASASAAGSSSATPVETVRVMALNGPTGIGMAQLSQGDAYDVRFVGSTDEVVSAVSSGSVDIAAIPTNLASTLYNKTEGDVQLAAVDTYGMLYLLQNGEGVSSLQDLAGKHLYATGEGANPQYILEYLLEQAGLEPGVDVEVEYLAEHAELAALVATGDAELALLPEPFVAVAQAKGGDAVRVALDIGDEWKQTTGADLTMGCVVVRTEFAEQHPEAVAQFLDDLSASVDFANTDVDAAAQLCADLGILPSAEIAKAAIPECSLVCVTGDDAQAAVDAYLQVLFDANPKSVGGSLPDEAFYY